MDKGPIDKWQLDAKVRRTVLEMVSPSEKELDRLERTTRELLRSADNAIKKIGLKEVRPMMAGSVAKGTMSNDPDLDLFILFPPGTSDKELEKNGMKIGRMILEDPIRKYTQHPYLAGKFKGFRCDVVPCISIEKGSKIKTAVDRTPHHTMYINSRLKKEQKEEVVLLKSFLKGIGGYGAEETVQGFSGYLTEILVLRLGDFDGVIDFLSGIDMGVEAPDQSEKIQKTTFEGETAGIIIFDSGDLVEEEPLDEKEYFAMFSNDPLIVIDPVDRRRNVASPISPQTLAFVSKSSKELMKRPTTDLFSPFTERPWTSADKGRSSSSGCHFFTLRLPEGDPGIVITQLRRSLRKLSEELHRKDFQEITERFVLRFPPEFDIDQSYLRARNIWEGDVKDPMVLVSLKVDPEVLEPEYEHWGPPLDNKRMKDFQEKYGDQMKIDGSLKRAFVILKRDLTDPTDISLDIWRSIHHGSRYQNSILEPVDEADLEEDLRDALTGDPNQL